MKKIFFALAAVAALASCSKVEAEYEQTGEIALAPIPKNITKSMIAGDGKGKEMAFPTSEEFNVWAWYKPLDAGTSIEKWMKDAAKQQQYIKESTFKKKTDSESWGGKSSPYFWPKPPGYPGQTDRNSCDSLRRRRRHPRPGFQQYTARGTDDIPA